MLKRIQQGYTLTELMAVVCIIAVTATVGIPAIDGFFATQKVSAEGETFASGLRMARYMALQENSLYRLVFLKDDTDDNTIYAYKIQRYTKYEKDISDIDKNSPDIESDISDGLDIEEPSYFYKDIDAEYDSADWTSALDTEEVIINDSVTALIMDNATNPVYIYPTGNLVHSNNRTTSGSKSLDDLTDSKYDLISEQTITFTYGNAKVTIRYNFMGVLSSDITSVENSDD